ncbi:sensor histidine kinase [Ammoniphilus sp. 3BR4]|uniref:sensor histidine kinase n=1 Tax=Ammoniphilus sp. 3BR4 TaxID=3158265 RepID=UPI0034659609
MQEEVVSNGQPRFISDDLQGGLALFLIAILTAIAGEFKVMPFSWEPFRFSLGSATFFFLLLILQPKSYIRAGLVTGITVMAFRSLLDAILGSFSLSLSFQHHFPAMIYYVLYSWGLSRLRLENLQFTPIRMGFMAAGIEFIVNAGEHLLRLELLGTDYPFRIREWFLLLLVAIFRSYFVVGLYSSIKMPEQQKKMESMLELGSGLYGETLYLQKSMDHIEQITASSHDLYRKLKEMDEPHLSRQALGIAQQIHEVKKDSQRILAGLSKLYRYEQATEMKLAEVLDFVVKANEKYNEMLGKSIMIQRSSSIDWDTDQPIPLLSMLNNLVANAVESIEHVGTIEIEAVEKHQTTWFTIRDTGNGIAPEDLELIFEPGFTTKFNENGVASTGIGLSHVKEIVNILEGDWDVRSSEAGTTFEIRIPTNKIRKETHFES